MTEIKIDAEIKIDNVLRQTIDKAYHYANNPETRKDYASAIKGLVNAKIMLEKWAREKRRADNA